MTSTALPGEWVDHAPGLDDLAGTFKSRVSTDRYRSREYAEHERHAIWMKTWQVAGRVDDLPKVGDWMEYKIYDQSFLIVRGKDENLRGFVNACRHRGNAICQGRTGNVKRGFLCQYHLWSYDLDGRLKGLLREESAGGLDKSDNSLIQVPVDTFGGFIFINPDPAAQPLAEWLGAEAMATLAPYHLELMSTVMNVREALDCNWKVVMDAFNEGYHVNGVHPQLLAVLNIQPETTRYKFFENHSIAMAPFEVVGATAEKQVEGTLALPETFPGTVAVIPRFIELVKEYTTGDGSIEFPEGVTARTLLQKATRGHLTEIGLDVGGLTDAQMSDNHGWFLFPNFMMTIRAGECHVILARPHPDGDPNRCIWHVASYMYLPPEMADAFTVDLIEVDEPGSYKYFEALQQDYEQMQRQQSGLRSEGLDHLTLVKEEVVVAKFHDTMDRWMAGKAAQ
jgi:phenylpropionate dioxygenase-like ring-hydroxylating dioxygenase large terminal subunit